MANFTRLYKTITEDWRKDARVEGIPSVVLTDRTLYQRKSLKDRLDEFCTFSWNGVNAFDTFGAFIISKDSLKFYNGPSYSNQYTQPLFTDGEQTITGLKFGVQKISFNIGIYWISEEHYRRLIYWLNPYEVGALVFDFEPMWHYNCKLAGVKDSTRIILGHENSFRKFNPDNMNAPVEIAGDYPMYYTELTLDFELQGEPCARYNIPYSFAHSRQLENNNPPDAIRGIWKDVSYSLIEETKENLTEKIYETFLPNISLPTTGNIKSDLATDFIVSIPLKFKAKDSYTLDLDPNLRILLEAVYTIPSETDSLSDEEETITLMDMTLEKMSYIFEEIAVENPKNALMSGGDAISSQAPIYTFSYNSADGLVFLRMNGEEEKLLTKLQTLANGQRFVKTLVTQQFKMPGVFDFPTFDFNKFSIRLTLSGTVLQIVDLNDFLQNTNNADTILMYARTNLI